MARGRGSALDAAFAKLLWPIVIAVINLCVLTSVLKVQRRGQCVKCDSATAVLRRHTCFFLRCHIVQVLCAAVCCPAKPGKVLKYTEGRENVWNLGSVKDMCKS